MDGGQVKRTQKTARKRSKALPILLILLALGALCGVLLRGPLLRRRYPLPAEYRPYVASAAAEFGLPEDLLCGVIWCESRFQADAESSAGACGLMQMTRETFGEVLWRLDLPTDADIFDPALNIRCGAFYLNRLCGLYGGALDTALAAYNAGMGNVNRWLGDSRYSDDGKTLREIPFAETAAYLQRVRAARETYRDLYPEEFPAENS